MYEAQISRTKLLLWMRECKIRLKILLSLKQKKLIN
jgi:hypothetical protein